MHSRDGSKQMHMEQASNLSFPIPFPPSQVHLRVEPPLVLGGDVKIEFVSRPRTRLGIVNRQTSKKEFHFVSAI